MTSLLSFYIILVNNAQNVLQEAGAHVIDSLVGDGVIDSLVGDGVIDSLVGDGVIDSLVGDGVIDSLIGDGVVAIVGVGSDGNSMINISIDSLSLLDPAQLTALTETM